MRVGLVPQADGGNVAKTPAHTTTWSDDTGHIFCISVMGAGGLQPGVLCSYSLNKAECVQRRRGVHGISVDSLDV